MRADFVLDALEQALFDRQPQCHEPLVHHSVDADLQLTKTQPTRERRPVFCPANRPTVSCLDEGAHPKIHSLLLAHICIDNKMVNFRIRPAQRKYMM